MATFRVVKIGQTREIGHEEWAVERSSVGEETHVVSRLYLVKRDAQAEADRLKARETGE